MLFRSKMEKEHQDYVKDIRMQVLREEDPKVESPHDKKKESIRLSDSV